MTSPNKDLIICIMSCKKNDKLRQVIRKTWLIDCPYAYRFFLGGDRPDSAEKDEVYLDCPDTYEGQEIKSIGMLNYAGKEGYANLFKCDDDSYLNWKLLPTVLNLRHDYGGRLVGKIDRKYFYEKVAEEYKKPAMDELNVPYAAGMGYFLSKNAFEKVLAIAPRKWDGVMRFEDEFVGDSLYRQGIKVKEISHVLLNDIEKIFGRFVPNIKLENYLIIHHCTVSDFCNLYNKKLYTLRIKYLIKRIIINMTLRIIGQLKNPHIPVMIKEKLKKYDK